MTKTILTRISATAFFIALGFFSLLAPAALSPAQAQVPDSVSFQGFLTDAAGDTLNATVSIKFTLYDGATVRWTETHPAVTVAGGIFNVYLGSVVPLDSVYFDRAFNLGITIDSDSEIGGQTPLAAAPYALGMRGIRSKNLKDAFADVYNIVGGHPMNRDSAAAGATIGGGGGRFLSGNFPHLVTGFFPTIGGGAGNEAWSYSTVAGGSRNRAIKNFSTIGGGAFNVASGDIATVAGGRLNTASGDTAFVGGGIGNTALGTNSVVVGGSNNLAHFRGTVGGGVGNTASNSATVSGGIDNNASGKYAAIPGGGENEASGDYSFAAGHMAIAKNTQTFVWNGGSDLTGSFESTGPRQFVINAPNGVGIGTNDPDVAFHVMDDSLGFVSGTSLSADVVIEDTDAILTLASADDGDWGSAVILGEVASGPSLPKWALGRKTSSEFSAFYLTYGTGSSYGANPQKLQVKTNGNVYFYGDLLPDISTSFQLGGPSNRWTDIYLVNAPNVSSDARLKKNIAGLSYGLDAVLALRPVTYDWKKDIAAGKQIGLIAQEVEGIIPEIVRAPENEDDMYSMQYDKLVPVLIKAIQEQQARLDAQDVKIASLEARLTN
jgi:hypothetical protein